MSKQLAKFLPKEDPMFKTLFGSEGSEPFLKSFIESALNIKINHLMLNNKEKINHPKGGKKNYLDILATLDDGTKVNVEMQSVNSTSFEKRVLEYWAQVYLDKFKSGEDYNKLNKTIAIWILDQDWFKEKEDYHTNWKIQEIRDNISGHFEDLELHFMELKKFKKYAIMKPEELTKLECWLSFIDHTDEGLVDMAVRSEKEIREAMKKYEELSQDEEMIRLYNHERREKAYQLDLLRDAKNEGKKEGIKEGEQKASMEIAKKFLKQGLDAKIISECTNLSIDEIKKLK